MEENQNISNNTDKENLTEKQQEDLNKLLNVLDDCIENMDKLYYFAKAKEILTQSKDN